MMSTDRHHEHGYFPFEKMITFERLDNPSQPLYERIEWVILTCKCGDTIKRPVREEKNETN